MLSLISTAVAAAPAAPGLVDPALASPASAELALASVTPANAALAMTASANAVPLTAMPSRVRPDAATWLNCNGSAFGAGLRAAGQAEFARQQRANKKYAHPMTRIAPTGGGGLGPYPARDPV